MPRRTRPITIDDIDVTLLPFQSRTTLGQYVLLALEERRERVEKSKVGTDSSSRELISSIALIMPEFERGDKITV